MATKKTKAVGITAKKANAIIAENTKTAVAPANSGGKSGNPKSSPKSTKVYFKDCKTLEDVRSQFLDYALKTRNAESCKAFMEQYLEVAKKLQNKHYVYGSDKIWEKAPANSPELFAKMVFALKKLKGVNYQLDGRLLWASGNTKANKETLIKYGFGWRPQKTQWVWTDVETKNWRAAVIPA